MPNKKNTNFMILEMQLCTQFDLWFVKHCFKPGEVETLYCSLALVHIFTGNFHGFFFLINTTYSP